MSSSTDGALAPALLAGWDAALVADDARYAAAYPGPPTAGVVHTVYVPAPAFTAGTVTRWGAAGLAAIEEFGPQWRAVLDGLTLGEPGGADRLDELTRAKLAVEPIEDLRIDFEDGFRSHRGTPADDSDEDAHVARVAALVRTGEPLARSWGVRIRSLGPSTRRRGLRTLDLFLGAVTPGGLPPGFVVTLPKVTSVEQVEVFVEVLAALEAAYALPADRLRFEIQVETPQTVLGADGRVPLAAMLRAGRGRVSGLHYGTYDYSASLGILAAHQDLRHPVADVAKSIMLLVAAETGVRVSDGSDNAVPVGDAATVLTRWRRHADGVQRALRQGIAQGWDLHPAQLPTRFAATFAFYRTGWTSAAQRLAAYAAGAPGPNGVLDEPATAFALARHLDAALVCGAVTEDELTAAAGIDRARAAVFLDRAVARPPAR